jgi:hypothetical protein
MADIDYSSLPEHLREGAQRYVEQGIMPGSFLRAAFENDFVSAVVRADDKSALALPEIARWLINEAPDHCWGCNNAVLDWVRAGKFRAAKSEKARA